MMYFVVPTFDEHFAFHLTCLVNFCYAPNSLGSCILVIYAYFIYQLFSCSVTIFFFQKKKMN